MDAILFITAISTAAITITDIATSAVSATGSTATHVIVSLKLQQL